MPFGPLVDVLDLLDVLVNPFIVYQQPRQISCETQ